MKIDSCVVADVAFIRQHTETKWRLCSRSLVYFWRLACLQQGRVADGITAVANMSAVGVNVVNRWPSDALKTKESSKCIAHYYFCSGCQHWEVSSAPPHKTQTCPTDSSSWTKPEIFASPTTIAKRT